MSLVDIAFGPRASAGRPRLLAPPKQFAEDLANVIFALAIVDEAGRLTEPWHRNISFATIYYNTLGGPTFQIISRAPSDHSVFGNIRPILGWYQNPLRCDCSQPSIP